MNEQLLTFSEWSMNERLICFWWSNNKSGYKLGNKMTKSLFSCYARYSKRYGASLIKIYHCLLEIFQFEILK
jgi:hypothetical protein